MALRAVPSSPSLSEDSDIAALSGSGIEFDFDHLAASVLSTKTPSSEGVEAQEKLVFLSSSPPPPSPASASASASALPDLISDNWAQEYLNIDVVADTGRVAVVKQSDGGSSSTDGENEGTMMISIAESSINDKTETVARPETTLGGLDGSSLDTLLSLSSPSSSPPPLSSCASSLLLPSRFAPSPPYSCSNEAHIIVTASSPGGIAAAASAITATANTDITTTSNFARVSTLEVKPLQHAVDQTSSSSSSSSAAAAAASTYTTATSSGNGCKRASADPLRSARMAKLNRERKKRYVAELEAKVERLEQERAAADRVRLQAEAEAKSACAETMRLRAALASSPAIARVLGALGTVGTVTVVGSNALGGSEGAAKNTNTSSSSNPVPRRSSTRKRRATAKAQQSKRACLASSHASKNKVVKVESSQTCVALQINLLLA